MIQLFSFSIGYFVLTRYLVLLNFLFYWHIGVASVLLGIVFAHITVRRSDITVRFLMLRYHD